MGNCGEKFKSGIQNVFIKKKNGGSKIGKGFNCPKCNKYFAPSTSHNTLNVHLDSCVNNGQFNIINENNNVLQLDQQTQQQNNLPSQNESLQIPLKEDFYWEKVPLNKEKTQWKWEQKIYKVHDIAYIRKLNIDQIKKYSFPEKMYWFRYQIEKLRIPWQKGAEWVTMYTDNVLLSSMEAIKNINLHKEMKVKINGDKVNDAGGLLREWIHLIIKEALHQHTGMFIMAETEDVTYRVNPEADVDEHIINCFDLFGKALAKAIFERIPITAYLDHTILKFILNQKVELEDIYYFDKQLYKSWKFILENEFTEDDFFETFTIYTVNGFERKMVELKPNGQCIVVTNENKHEYIDLCIQYLTKTSIKPFLEGMAKAFYQVIPRDLIGIFNVNEFEMILNSTPFINLDDWKMHTQYQGEYHQNSKYIKLFWEVLGSFDQQKLQEFLRYCTGSMRTPIEGFKKLESNRGEFSQFCIRSIPYNKKNPYPIGHTCFNRLELPMYPDLETAQMYMNAVVSNDLDGVFGLD